MMNNQQGKDVMTDPVTAMGAGQDPLLQDLDVRTGQVLPLIVSKVLGLVSPNPKNCEAETRDSTVAGQGHLLNLNVNGLRFHIEPDF